MAGKYLSLLVHFIWSTKNREPWIERAMREDMYAYIGGTMRKKKATLLAAGGMFDHIHLYASLPSIISIADFVNAVKANSSRWVHDSFRDLRTFAWQEGYGAFSVSKSDEQPVIRYVQDQEKHHAKRTFKEEFISMLEQHEMPYDPQQIWK